MSEPDELYTLRAQYWLGHYTMAITEAKSIARRPMSAALKEEREEYLARSYTALGQYDKVTATDTPGLQAVALKAQYEALISTTNDENVRNRIIDELKTLAQGDSGINSTAQLVTAQVLLQENQVAAAYQCIGGGTSMEQLGTKLHILLKIDRLDLAKALLHQMRTIDEDSIVTQLCSVYVHLAEGRTGAADAEHTLNMLSEQYGPSSFLLNLTACALVSAGDYVGAESKLQECINDHVETACADTYVNLITAYIHQNKINEAYSTIQELQTKYPSHPYHAGIERVTTAFDREAIKYKV